MDQLYKSLEYLFIHVFRFDIKSSGWITAIPFFFQSVVCFAAGFFTDYVRSKDWMRTITIRKINTGLGLVVPAVTVVLAGYMGCNAVWSMIFFVLSLG